MTDRAERRDRPPPILVTGNHRSGTTWIGRLLAAHDEVFYVQEPLNVTTRPSWVRRPAAHWYEYLGTSDQRWADLDRVVRLRYPLVAGLRDARRPRRVASVLRRSSAAAWASARHRRPLVKDPFLVFNAEEFHRRYGGSVVFTVRHPAAFADSLRRRSWAFDVSTLLDQTELMDGPLQRWAPEIERLRGSDDIVAEACLLWRVVQAHVHEVTGRLPHSTVVVHEAFTEHTGSALPALFRDVGLTWTPAVERRTRGLVDGQHTETEDLAVNELHRNSRDAGRAWRDRLDPELVGRIEEACRPELDLFYGSRSHA